MKWTIDNLQADRWNIYTTEHSPGEHEMLQLLTITKINWNLLIIIQDDIEGLLLTGSYWLINLFTTTTTHYNWRIQCWPDNDDDEDKNMKILIVLLYWTRWDTRFPFDDIWTQLDLFIFRNRTGNIDFVTMQILILLIEWVGEWAVRNNKIHNMFTIDRSVKN